MNRTKIFEILELIFMVLAIHTVGSYVHNNMQDATPSSTESQQPTPSIELLLKENKQLKDKLAWMESEYQKLTKLFTAQLNKKSEKHLSPGGSPCLPFESQEEFQGLRRCQRAWRMICRSFRKIRNRTLSMSWTESILQPISGRPWKRSSNGLK